MKKKVFIIVDGNSFIHRAYHALPAFTNKEGFPTQIITGVVNMIHRVLNGIEHQRSVIAFDAGGKTFRHGIYKEYKANREPMPDTMVVQLEPLKKILNNMGLSLMEIPFVEADDSIGSLAKRAVVIGYDVVIVTSDKDMLQLVDENISLLDTKATENKTKLIPIDSDGVLLKMGVNPDQIIDYLAIVGDVSDNIIGIKGWGHKTAVKALLEYGTLSNIIKNKDKFSGQKFKNLSNALESGSLNLAVRLVTLKTDVDLGKDIESFVGSVNNEELINLFNKYNLKGLKKKLGILDPNTKTIEFKNISLEHSIKKFFECFSGSNLIIDTFIFGKKPYLILMEQNSSHTYTIDLNRYKKEVEFFVSKIIKSNSKISSHNSKEVLKVLFNVTFNKKVFDVLLNDISLISSHENGGSSKNTSIEYLNEEYCGFELSSLREKFSLNKKSQKWSEMTLEEVLIVKNENIIICEHILFNNSKILSNERFINDNKLMSILALMEHNGVLIDKPYLLSLGNDIKRELEFLELVIYEKAHGNKFNIASPKQVSYILFDVLGIKSKTKGTSEKVLSLLKSQYSIVGDILSWRSLKKILTTSVDGIISKADENNVVHTNYNSTLVSTGRLSSSNPNMQAIPLRGGFGKKIRKSFIARNGCKIVALDYSQVELRILAYRSKDKNLLKAFSQNKDVHTLTASKIFNVEENEITIEQRQVGKKINFGLVNGLSSRALSVLIGTQKKEAAEYQKGFFDYFSDIKPYFVQELKFARANHYVVSSFGRKIKTKDLDSPNSHAKSHAENAATNAGMQGTASDIINRTLISISDYIKKTNLDVKILMQVHDELVFEVPADIAEAIADLFATLMETDAVLSVKLKVNVKISDHY